MLPETQAIYFDGFMGRPPIPFFSAESDGILERLDAIFEPQLVDMYRSRRYKGIVSSNRAKFEFTKRVKLDKPNEYSIIDPVIFDHSGTLLQRSSLTNGKQYTCRFIIDIKFKFLLDKELVPIVHLIQLSCKPSDPVIRQE